MPVAGCVGLLLTASVTAGCADREPDPAPPATSTPAEPPTKAASPSGSPTTTSLTGMPVPVSVGDSPVDASRLRSLDDLPGAFGCPTNVAPIRIPASPPATDATVPPAPEALVCASALAGKEAVYLWYTPTQEAKLAALTEALARTNFVHGGPNWVAAGMVNPTLGSVGGEVYR